MDGLDLWTRAEFDEKCGVLGEIPPPGHVMTSPDLYSFFVHIPYSEFHTDREATTQYLASGVQATCYLVRVDCTDVRHAVFAFAREDDRDAFLQTGIVTRRERRRG